MAFDLNEFKNKLVNGGARPNQFEMQITWPDAVRGGQDVSTAERDFRFFCTISEIPAATIGTVTVNYFGRILKYAGDRTFTPLKVTIINDEDFKVRRALETWQKAITDFSTTLSQFNGGAGSGSYVTDGVVVQHSRNSGGSPLIAYKFIGMYPTNISNIDLDWSKEAIETFTVDFEYHWWEQIDASTGAQALA